MLIRNILNAIKKIKYYGRVQLFHNTLFILLIISISSCMSFYRTMSGLKHPRVETKQRINAFITNSQLNDDKLNFYFSDSIPQKYIKRIANNIFDGQLTLFGKNGERKCYVKNETCVAEQLEVLSNSFEESVDKCKSTIDTVNFYQFNNLQSLLSKIISPKSKQLNIYDLPKSDYYLVYYWSIFGATKNGIEADYLWMKEWVNKMDKKITIIKINCDLRNDWGLKEGKKMKMLINKIGKRQYEMKYDSLPIN